MNEFPTLHTPRLVLGELKFDDIPKIVECANNPNIARNLSHMPYPYIDKYAVFWLSHAYQSFDNQTGYIFKIGLKETNEFIGGMNLHINKIHYKAEVGYWLGEPFWNKGYTTEALKATLKFGFEVLELNKIYATHFTDNPASGKVLINNGMIKEGELVDDFKKGDEYFTLIQYRLTKSEYEQHKNKL